MRKNLRALALAAALLGTSVGLATPANATPTPTITIYGTVLNRIVDVYNCSVFTGRCRYAYRYQSNPPYNPSVGVTYVRENHWVWYWI
jgi:hypothetical protein